MRILRYCTFHFIAAIIISVLTAHGAYSANTNDLNVTGNRKFTGVTKPIRDLTLSMPVPGTIKEVLVKKGQWVEEGELILQLKNRKEKFSTKLRKKQWQSKASLNSAQKQEEKLRLIYNSSKTLYENTQSLSKEKLMKQELKYLQTHYKRKKLENQEEQEKLKYQIAKSNLEDRSMYAPIEGGITEIKLYKGERCQANQPLIRIVDTSVCKFVCNLEPEYASSFSLGDNVKLYINAGADKIKKRGEVVFVSPIVDSSSNLREVEIEFENEQGAISPGVSGVMVYPN